MEIIVLNKYQNNDEGTWVVTFKYWEKGNCACSAIKKQVELDFNPVVDDLIELI